VQGIQRGVFALGAVSRAIEWIRRTLVGELRRAAIRLWRDPLTLRVHVLEGMLGDFARGGAHFSAGRPWRRAERAPGRAWVSGAATRA